MEENIRQWDVAMAMPDIRSRGLGEPTVKESKDVMVPVSTEVTVPETSESGNVPVCIPAPKTPENPRMRRSPRDRRPPGYLKDIAK